MKRDDAWRVHHMMDAAEAVQQFLTGRTRSDLDQDMMFAFALARAIEIIGEAASKVSPETRTATPQVPWSAIVAMRNRLVHAYLDINHDALWKTATQDVPELNRLLRALPLGD